MANRLYGTYRNRQMRAVHLAITAATNASPIVITSNGHNLGAASTTGFIFIQGVLGNTAANGYFRFNVVDANSFELQNATGLNTYGNSTGNGAYTAGTGVATNSIDWMNDNIKAVLAQIAGGGNPYTVTIGTDTFLSQVGSGGTSTARKDGAAGFTTTSPNLAGKSVGASSDTPPLGCGAATATTLPLVTATGAVALGAVILYMDPYGTGTPSDSQASLSPLIAYIDTATGLPITPSGGDITLSWQQTFPFIFCF